MAQTLGTGHISEQQRLSERLRNSWTYLDVLALAMATSDLEKFDADPTKWNRLVEDFQKRYTMVFDEVFFDRRDPNSLQSQEVDGFLRLMVSSGNVLVSPALRRYEMRRETKEAIARALAPRLETNRAVVDEIAQAMNDALRVKPRTNGAVEQEGH